MCSVGETAFVAVSTSSHLRKIFAKFSLELESVRFCAQELIIPFLTAITLGGAARGEINRFLVDLKAHKYLIVF